jgi:signal transduction histidine kinase
LAETKEIEIRTEIDGPPTFWGDESRIRQLLIILLDNALKFTPPGGSITVSCRQTANVVHLGVRDTGHGISRSDLPHIFERFYRADKARSRPEGGTGLGLSIAKWIVTAHGGEIRVHSTPGDGTEMLILLPVRKNRDEK